MPQHHWQAKQKQSAGVEDMVLLSKISDDAVVENLKKRIMDDLMFTYIGPVLICVNPFKSLPYFTDKEVEQYQGSTGFENPPHVYAIADNMYRNMMIEYENQCVIISGESGAGKTVEAKFIMSYIAKVSGGGERVQKVKDVILESNPLLEAFGNAKTVRNNNSSRFGKYFEIQFSRGGEPDGGKISNFLLEKSRVCQQNRDERNFHIFYQMCAGCTNEEREQLGLSTPDYFSVLNKSGCYEVDDMNDAEEYVATRHAMSVVGIDLDTQFQVLKLVASILHLANLNFVENGNYAQVQDAQFLEFPAYLLGVSTTALNEKLTSRLMEARWGGKTETTTVTLNAEQANFTRDALCKALYSRLFDYLVESINSAMVKKKEEIATGVLDIYGFEIFEKNGFEQFCINFVNEKLQQIFIQLTLKAEQEEYVAEGIKWTPIDYFNNKVVCDLIEEKKPPGIMCVLDDVCATMHAVGDGADNTLIEKLRPAVGSNQYCAIRSGAFEISHYAGKVLYDADGFCERNRDVLFKDLIILMQQSASPFLVSLFPEDTTADDKKRPTTASSKIKTQANLLVATLMKCTPHYVRCIKPNESKKPKDFDATRVLHQVKYLGLKENIRVRRAGFAYRQTFEKFVRRFNILSEETWPHWKGAARDGCQVLLNKIELEKDQWQLGKTKVFIKNPESLFLLEELRERKYDGFARTIQKAYRLYKSQQYYVELKKKAASIFVGKKERRRASINRNYVGDYIGYGDNHSLRALVGKKERVEFADTVTKYDRKFKPDSRDLLLTSNNIYLIGLEKIAKGPDKGKIVNVVKRCIPLQSIKCVSLSTKQDDFVVIHVNEDYDTPFQSVFKTEFITMLNAKYTALVHRELPVTFSDSITFTVKKTTWEKSGTRTITFAYGNNKVPLIKPSGKGADVFVEQGLPKETQPTTMARAKAPSGGRGAASQQPRGAAPQARGPAPQHAAPQAARGPAPQATGGAIRPGSTMPGTRGPAPMAAAAAAPAAASAGAPRRLAAPAAPAAPSPVSPKPVAKPKPVVPQCRALYDYDARDVDELSFRAGDLIQIVNKDNEGWWQGKLKGKGGLFPSNYVEMA